MRSRSDTPWQASPLALLLALTAAAGLLAGFTLVLTQNMHRSAERRVEDTARVDAHWRCQSSKGAQARADCLVADRAAHFASQAFRP